ncbi:conserved hypothetical protein (plasmid) [Borreliella spielmanii A14S]|uniref:Uncharacterized protein n=1 Tax=Borreliella spielmanii A14S TaxID=498742 RepID=C0RBS3_9SPIR|nr:conserved hypothetical protein [Borreliella spielmanii A14S]
MFQVKTKLDKFNTRLNKSIGKYIFFVNKILDTLKIEVIYNEEISNF